MHHIDSQEDGITGADTQHSAPHLEAASEVDTVNEVHSALNSIESLPLFDIDIVAEAFKSTNKDIQRLYAPFKPRGVPPSSFNHIGPADAGNAIAMHSFLAGGRGRDGQGERTLSPSGVVLSQSLHMLGDRGGMDEEGGRPQFHRELSLS